jgi:hypothetical protein
MDVTAPYLEVHIIHRDKAAELLDQAGRFENAVFRHQALFVGVATPLCGICLCCG